MNIRFVMKQQRSDYAFFKINIVDQAVSLALGDSCLLDSYSYLSDVRSDPGIQSRGFALGLRTK